MAKEKSRATKQEEADAKVSLSASIRKMLEAEGADILLCEGVANPLRTLFPHLHHTEKYIVGKGWDIVRIDTYESHGKIRTVAFITADHEEASLLVECYAKNGEKTEQKWKLRDNLGPEIVKFLRKHLPKQ